MHQENLTPMMRQYYDIKNKYKDFILFFRLGDFYEMFDEDAEISSRILDIALTKRGEQKMCGIPYHALDNYLFKIIKANKKVAICEQMEEPGRNKIVKREVTEVVTPGTFIDEKHLSQNKDSFLVALEVKDNEVAIAACDVSTGKFWILEEKRDSVKIAALLKLIGPSEIILHKIQPELEAVIKKYYYTLIPDYYFSPSINEVLLLDHFKVGTVKGIGLHKQLLASVAGATLRYLKDNLFKDIKHLDNIRFIRPESYIYLPESTLRNLEILEPLFTSGEDSSLFRHMNHTITAMGARELRNWLVYPLLDMGKINERLALVEHLKNNLSLLKEVRELLRLMPDMERMLSKIGLARSTPKEIASFREGLKVSEKLKSLKNLEFIELGELPNLFAIIEKIESLLEDDPPVDFEEGGVIKEGIDPELDSLKAMNSQGKEYLLNIEKKEREKTGINSLKLRYNKVIGYYIEVSKSHLKSVPDYFIRKQSLVGGERYTIEELIEYESKILSAKALLVEKEKKIFQDLLSYLIEKIEPIRRNIDFIKKLDIIACFSYIAKEKKYSRPVITENIIINIEDGRHPVVEEYVEQFIPNSIYLDDKDNRLLLITGPNMAGKSTILRQTAIIALMAHIGSFVPAKKAEIGIIDQIFTRVGASDNLAGGESTFLVEMSETSQILRNASPRSLIIMDEIGRGTSTYDGLSLAWAIVEYLTDYDFNRGKTLFATHYHELTVLDQEKGVKNFRMVVKEWNDEIIFLHKVEPGAGDKSYGIHVAEIAGIPKSVIARAQEILSSMEINLLANENKLLKPSNQREDSLFTSIADPFEKVKSKILSLDINHTTPLQALLILEEVQRDMRKKK